MLFGQQGIEAMADDLSNMYELLAKRLWSGKAVPVLGVNLSDRRLGDKIGDVPENVANRDGRLRLIRQRLMDLLDIVDPLHGGSTYTLSDPAMTNRLAALSPEFVRVNYGLSPAR
jgi:hypothetical protein